MRWLSVTWRGKNAPPEVGLDGVPQESAEEQGTFLMTSLAPAAVEFASVQAFYGQRRGLTAADAQGGDATLQAART
jgi:hypothetical protein